MSLSSKCVSVHLMVCFALKWALGSSKGMQKLEIRRRTFGQSRKNKAIMHFMSEIKEDLTEERLLSKAMSFYGRQCDNLPNNGGKILFA